LELNIYQIRDLVDIFIDNLETLPDGFSSVPPRTPEPRGLAKERILDPKIHRILDTSNEDIRENYLLLNYKPTR
jgi:hypothetical protein